MSTTVRPVAKAKKRRQELAGISKKRLRRSGGWMVCGFDTSMLSIAGAAFGYDRVLEKYVGPVFSMTRWQKDDHYFERLKAAAKGHDIVLDLQAALGVSLGNDEIFICQEEPWPPHGSFVGRGISQSLKGQAEISGAFLGSLVRYGFQNIVQINSMRWRKMVADELGITVHHTKWRDPKLVEVYNCKPADTGKFRTKQWALGNPGPGYAFMHFFPQEIPDWPDIIERAEGKIPRPEGSVAKAVQPDDRYDALAIAWTLYEELAESGALSENLELA